MPKKSIPTVGSTGWGVSLNDHLSQLSSPTTGGLNFLSTDPSISGSDYEGYTYFNTTTKQLRRYNGSSWEILADNTPVGSIQMFASNSAPTNWLVCNGSAVSRSTYSQLFSIIGSTYGNGDGGTTFNLPNLQGRAPIGSNATSGNGISTRTIGDTGGEEGHTLTVNEMPSHNHNFNDPGHVHRVEETKVNGTTGGLGGWGTGIDTNTRHSVDSQNNTTGITLNAQGGGQSHNVMQPFLVVSFIIKAL